MTDEADRMRTPVWLFARPAGLPLYHKSGFIQAGETELDVPEFKVSRITLHGTTLTTVRCRSQRLWFGGLLHMRKTGSI